MYSIEVRQDVDKKLKKLAKKDKQTSKQISNKVKQIKQDPYKFKPLKKPLQGFWRVHIGSYVLIYSIDETNKRIIIEKYEHHDRA